MGIGGGDDPVLSSDAVPFAAVFHGTEMISVALPSMDSVADTDTIKSTMFSRDSFSVSTHPSERDKTIDPDIWKRFRRFIYHISMN